MWMKEWISIKQIQDAKQLLILVRSIQLQINSADGEVWTQ